MKNNRENVYDCTSSNFDGMIASAKPEDSWVCKWQRIGKKLVFLHKNENHNKGPFNNYVGQQEVGGGQQKVQAWSRDKGWVSFKMSTIVHLKI